MFFVLYLLYRNQIIIKTMNVAQQNKADLLKSQWEAKQQEIEDLINFEVEGRRELIIAIEDEIEILMREHYELTGEF